MAKLYKLKPLEWKPNGKGHILETVTHTYTCIHDGDFDVYMLTYYEKSTGEARTEEFMSEEKALAFPFIDHIPAKLREWFYEVEIPNV